jgi:hypothetical protein
VRCLSCAHPFPVYTIVLDGQLSQMCNTRPGKVSRAAPLPGARAHRCGRPRLACVQAAPPAARRRAPRPSFARGSGSSPGKARPGRAGRWRRRRYGSRASDQEERNHRQGKDLGQQFAAGLDQPHDPPEWYRPSECTIRLSAPEVSSRQLMKSWRTGRPAIGEVSSI